MADVELTTVAQEAAIDPAADKFPYIDVSLTPDATRYATVDNMLAAVDASTTEALTGTSAAKAVTPDALAALWEQGSDIASAGTISVGEGGYHHVTGTTTITDIDFATDKAGRKVWLKFNGILTLTHHATTLILPTGANIVTAAGDIACFISEGSDNVRCVSYTRASGAALAGSGSMAIGGAVTSGTDKSVLFIDASGNLAQDNTNFKFTDGSNLLELDNGVLKVGGSMFVAQGSIGGVKLLDVANTVFGVKVFQYSNGEVPFQIQQTAAPTVNAFQIVASDGTTVHSGANKDGIVFGRSGAAVASAAAIVPTGNVFHVTGTTTITSITATDIKAGTILTIIFDGILTFTDGSNLKLAGNFVTSADDTITLAFDGTNFYERCRSVN